MQFEFLMKSLLLEGVNYTSPRNFKIQNRQPKILHDFGILD